MKKLIRGGVFFSLGVLFSRILGYARDATIAYYFGSSHISDAFFIAFRIPNTFRRIFGEGGFNAVFIPFYGDALKNKKEKEFLNKISGIFFTSVFLITVLGILLSSQIVSVVAPGIREKETFPYAVELLKFTFPYLLFVSFYAFTMAILLVKGYFFIPSFSQALFNLALIISVFIFYKNFGYFSLAIGVLLGGFFQVLPNFFLILKEGIKFFPKIIFDKEVRTFLKKFSLTFFSFSANQLSFFIDTFLASFLKTGSISYIYYAGRIYLLPISVFSVGISNSLLAQLSKGESEKENLKASLNFVLLLSIPSAVGLILLSEEIVSLLYERGKFNYTDVLITSNLLKIYALSVPVFSIQHIYKSVFYSKKQISTVVKATFLGVISEGILSSFLIFVLNFGIISFPISVFISSTISLLYLVKNYGWKFPAELSNTFKILISTIFMGVLVLLAKMHINSKFVVFLIPLFAGFYFLLSYILKENITYRFLKRIFT